MLVHRTSSELFDLLSVGLLEADLDGHVVRANSAANRVFGPVFGDVRGIHLCDLAKTADPAADIKLRQLYAGTRATVELRLDPLTDDGRTAAARLRCQLVAGLPDRPDHVLAELLIGDRGQAAEMNVLMGVFTNSPTAIYMKDVEGGWMLANPECCRIVGQPAEVLSGGTPMTETMPEEAARALASSDHQVIANDRPMTFIEDVYHHQRESPRQFLSVKFPVHDETGTIVGAGGISFDVTDRDRTQRELASARTMLAKVIAAARLGIVVTRYDEETHGTEVVECNDAYAKIVGRERASIIGSSGDELVHPDDRAARLQMIDDLIAGATPVSELRHLRPDGTPVWCMTVPAMTFGPDGERLFVLQIIDITERRVFEHELRHNAEHDGLTDLLSRRRFVEMLAQEVDRVRRTGGSASVLLLDIDGFKYVNDVLGHSTGDALLRQLSVALSASIRETDQLARLGGDEFAFLLPDTGPDGANALAEKLVATVYEHGRISTGAGRVEVTASVGVTSWAGSLETTAESLLGEADIAMYDAKEAGKNGTSIYERGERRRQRLAHRSDRLAQLRKAIDAGRFVLHAQPIVPLNGHVPEVPHYELLVRMRREDGSLAMPADFLPDAQRHGLIGDIDEWSLAEAVAMIKRMESRRRISVSVNLSANTIEDPELGNRIVALLRRHLVAPELLTLELTETRAISDLRSARELSLQVSELGCKLALDDFGAAFATLQYLKHIHFDQLKIDGDFIRKLPASPTDQLIVKAIADIAAAFDAEVVAEFVESRETVELLRSFGVQYGQGYFLGRPAPLEFD